MGTNYYWESRPCSSCGRFTRLHIGKRSAGWIFLLHVYPDYDLNGLLDWIKWWADNEGTIKSETGLTLTPEEMAILIDRTKMYQGEPAKRATESFICGREEHCDLVKGYFH